METVEMTLVCVDPRTDPRWDALVERHGGGIFHSPPWLRVLADTYGFDVAAHVLLDERGQPVAGVPFCRLADMRGERSVVLPFSDYCDPLASDPADWRRLAGLLCEDDVPVSLRCLHNDLPLADERFTLTKRAKWHGMDLRPDVDTLWRTVDPAVRQWVRKAQRSGVEVRPARDEDELRAFFMLHLRNRKAKYRLLAQPYRFFEQIWRQFHGAGDQRRLMLLGAFDGGRMIGGTLFLEWNGTLYYKFNASDPGHLSLRPNDLIIWEAIGYAKARGLTYLDFGLSDWDQEGLIRFKRKFATDEKTISFLRHEPERGGEPAPPQVGATLAAITDLFTDAAVPDDVTERAGDLLYRFFA